MNLYFRAYGGDEDGSVYLQAFATFLQDHYLNIPLDRIYLMVKRAMIEAKQVEDLLENIQMTIEWSFYELNFVNFTFPHLDSICQIDRFEVPNKCISLKSLSN